MRDFVRRRIDVRSNFNAATRYALGLLVGKPLGIFTFSWAAVKWALLSYLKALTSSISLRYRVVWYWLYNVYLHFLFSVRKVSPEFDTYARLGILMGSTTAHYLAMPYCTFLCLRKRKRKKK